MDGAARLDTVALATPPARPETSEPAPSTAASPERRPPAPPPAPTPSTAASTERRPPAPPPAPSAGPQHRSQHRAPAPSTAPAPSADQMERPQPDSMPQDLSEALKEATKEVHVQAENAEFMKNFQKGQVTRKGFKLVMASLYHVYVALEEEIERNKENPVYAPLYFPEELHRKAALERDMAFWYGPHWEEAIPYTQATRRYVRRLHEVGRMEPELLVAHAYTRYLGDLSGGQVLKKIAQKALDLPSSGEGVDFFTFPNVASATKFKQLYRARMNTLEMTPEVRQRVIEEAKAAFLLNIQLFEELQQLLGQDPEDQSPAQAPGPRRRVGSRTQDSAPVETPRGKSQPNLLSQAPLLRWVLTLSFVVATVAVGLYVM